MREPAEVVGFFILLLGVGLIIDVDWVWGGGCVMAVGCPLLGASRAWLPRGS